MEWQWQLKIHWDNYFLHSWQYMVENLEHFYSVVGVPHKMPLLIQFWPVLFSIPQLFYVHVYYWNSIQWSIVISILQKLISKRTICQKNKYYYRLKKNSKKVPNQSNYYRPSCLQLQHVTNYTPVRAHHILPVWDRIDHVCRYPFH